MKVYLVISECGETLNVAFDSFEKANVFASGFNKKMKIVEIPVNNPWGYTKTLEADS